MTLPIIQGRTFFRIVRPVTSAIVGTNHPCKLLVITVDTSVKDEYPNIFGWHLLKSRRRRERKATLIDAIQPPSRSRDAA
jgi:hypothetical protein